VTEAKAPDITPQATPIAMQAPFIEHIFVSSLLRRHSAARLAPYYLRPKGQGNRMWLGARNILAILSAEQARLSRDRLAGTTLSIAVAR
jgi:hypothetical protein